MNAFWEHFRHGADIGVRGVGPTKAAAFEQAALALTSVACDLGTIRPTLSVDVSCQAPTDELLLVDWLNAIVFEMATRRALFGRFEVAIAGDELRGVLHGEPVARDRHEPAVEVKGATHTELAVTRREHDWWVAQCVVDV